MEVELLDVDLWLNREAIDDATADGLGARGVRRPREGMDRHQAPRLRRALLRAQQQKVSYFIALLSDHAMAHGNPLSAQTIYWVFAEIEPRPRRWSPHKGGHTFACFEARSSLMPFWSTSKSFLQPICSEVAFQ